MLMPLCRRAVRALLLLLPLLFGAGCLATHKERIHVRRTPEQLQLEQLALRPLDPEVRIEAALSKAEDERLPPDLVHALKQRKETLTDLERSRQGPTDPWLAYELERKQVLHRSWPDVHQKEPYKPQGAEGP